MKRFMCFGIVLLTFLPFFVQTTISEKAPFIWEREIERDLSLENAASARIRELGGKLRPEAKAKLNIIIQSILGYLASDPDNSDAYALAQQGVRQRFLRLSEAQYYLLTFYVIAETSRIIAHPDELKQNLEIMDIVSEVSIRLQMLLDRRSKFMQALSSLMKKISDTEADLIQNLK